MELDAVFQWNMTSPEIDVFKLAVLYEREFRKIFGEEIDGQALRRNSLPKRSDPRKSNLFRHCWKMARETRGLIDPHDYKNYIHANLIIIKLNKGHVEPNCICGDKAWVRWKVWKRRYDQKMAEVGATAPPPSVSTTNPKLIAEIDRTKKFLFERCEGNPTYEKISGFIEGGFFKMWVATGKVSPYYLVLSPFVEKSGGLKQLFTVCTSSEAVVREKVTSEVKDYFKHEYRHEFGG